MIINEQCSGSIQSPFQMSHYCVEFLSHYPQLMSTDDGFIQQETEPFGSLLYQAEHAGIVKSPFASAFPGSSS